MVKYRRIAKVSEREPEYKYKVTKHQLRINGTLYAPGEIVKEPEGEIPQDYINGGHVTLAQGD